MSSYFAENPDETDIAYERGWDDYRLGHFCPPQKETLASAYIAGYKAKMFQDFGEPQFLH